MTPSPIRRTGWAAALFLVSTIAGGCGGPPNAATGRPPQPQPAASGGSDVAETRSAVSTTYTVTKTVDTNDGVCDADCSLREAIGAANANPGADTINVPAGTYTLTLAFSDDANSAGDLDVIGPVSINGAGQGSTIIQGGTSATLGIDKIFSFNPIGNYAGFAVALSNVTLRYGRNPEPFYTLNSVGGCFDFDSGTDGAGSLTMTNVTITDCQTIDGDGGGGAIFLTHGGSATLTNVTVQNSTAHRPATNFAVGGGLYLGCVLSGNTASLTISGSTISGNKALDTGGQGGGLFLAGPCSGTPTLSYGLHDVTISGNQAANDGGGVYSTAPLTIDDTGGASVIANNTSGRSGGGIWLNHTNQTSTLTKVSITGNSAADGGGGIRLDSAAPGNQLNLGYSRIVNNTAGSGKGTGLSVNNGIAVAENNWWGCSTGPSAAPCDTAKVDPGSGGGAAGTGSVDANPWLRVVTTATPTSLAVGESASLSASVNTNSDGQDVSGSNDVLRGLGVTWSAAGGSISGADTTIQPDGTASATYQATSVPVGGNRAAAVVDHDGTSTGSNVASITVTGGKADTTTAITSDSPDASVVGQSVTVQFSVTPATSGTPTGNVTVSDGTVSCTATVAAGQCSLTFTSAGARSLTATYAGDASFNGSTSAAEAHTVNRASTTTAITSDSPDPSPIGVPVAVQYSVTASAPGAGTPAGTVTVSDGTISCTGTVSGGQCSLTFTSSGSRTLTATYSGDSNFDTSTSAGEPHGVADRSTTTTITSDTPDPSVVGQSVAVQFSVVASAGGTPTGNVTVSDGTVSCTGTVAAGQCSLTFTSAGAKSLTATYAGDASYGGSTSAAAAHTVNAAGTTTAITADAPDPSVVGQAVTVQYGVAVNAPGAGTPTGNVTVSDGVDSCTGTVASGQCSLTLTTAGSRTLTATYAGDSSFGGSTSAAEAHLVGLIKTTLLYDGAQIVNVGQTFQPAAKLSSPSTGCSAAQQIGFSLDRNPFSGAPGAYALGTATSDGSGQATAAAVSTAGWLEGVYDIRAAFTATATCDASSDQATLTVAMPGTAANGGGWYTLPGSGHVNFGFTVRKVDSACRSGCAYKGQLTLVNNGKWRLKGALATFSKTSTGAGAASGKGDLYWWNATLNGGLGDWVLAAAGVDCTISFYDSGKSGKSDTFGIRILYTPVSPPQPASLPNSAPQPLKGGNVSVG